MDKKQSKDIYEHAEYLNCDVNVGEKTIHARHMHGRFRNIKWLTFLAIYGPYFLLPFFQWGERQAVLFQIPQQKFYFFGLVMWPQDLWILALILLFCFVLLFAMTAISGRIFCGFVCPQSVWTDVLTWIEFKVEGKAGERVKLDAAPWGPTKIRKKVTKHALWLAFCAATAMSFISYFSGTHDAWTGLFTLNYNVAEWVTFIIIVVLFYVNTGFVREQVCNWICPYARIQGVMTDDKTIITTYDELRGESRGRLKRGKVAEGNGDCIDCNICVSVCPTGVDIRKGNQIGCINCGLCIDACDSVMKKVKLPQGLIRFMSHNEATTGKADDKHYLLRPRPLFYMFVTVASVVAIAAGLLMTSPVAINVHHERSPLFTIMSDRSIQNVYHMDFMNKTEETADFILNVSGMEGISSNADGKAFHLKSGELKKFTLRVRIQKKLVKEERHPIRFELQSTTDPETRVDYESVFIGPRH